MTTMWYLYDLTAYGEHSIEVKKIYGNNPVTILS